MLAIISKWRCVAIYRSKTTGNRRWRHRHSVRCRFCGWNQWIRTPSETRWCQVGGGAQPRLGSEQGLCRRTPSKHHPILPGIIVGDTRHTSVRRRHTSSGMHARRTLSKSPVALKSDLLTHASLSPLAGPAAGGEGSGGEGLLGQALGEGSLLGGVVEESCHDSRARGDEGEGAGILPEASPNAAFP